MNASSNSPAATDFFTIDALCQPEQETPGAFDALTRLAMRLFKVPVALISIVQEERDRQYFLSHQGLGEPWRGQRQTPLSHSFCQHVKREGKPLMVSDARVHPLVADNRAVDELNVIAYLGVPIIAPEGSPAGALCVIENQVREWTETELETLKDLARCVNDEILLRAMLALNETQLRKSLRYNAMRESIAMAFMSPDLPVHTRFEELLRASCKALGMKAGRICKTGCGQAEPLFDHDEQGHIAALERRTDFKALTSEVISECRHVAFDDLAKSHNSDGLCGSYAGTPLILNGVLHGVVEFFSDEPRSQTWSEEEFSILSIVSMFATAHLSVFGQIKNLKQSEEALLHYIAQQRQPVAAS